MPWSRSTSSAVWASRYRRYWSTAALPSAVSLVSAVPVTTSLPLSCSAPPGHLVVYVPAFSVSEKSPLSPGAMFSTSPRMRSPESTSNSLTSPRTLVGTLNVVGPGLGLELGRAAVVVDGRPSRSAVLADRRCRRGRPTSMALAQGRRPRPRPTSGAEHRGWIPPGNSVGQTVFDGRGDRRCDVGAAAPAGVAAGRRRRHRDRVGEEREELAPGGLGLDAEHPGDERRLHGARDR